MLEWPLWYTPARDEHLPRRIVKQFLSRVSMHAYRARYCFTNSLSVRLSVRHVVILHLNEGTYRHIFDSLIGASLQCALSLAAQCIVIGPVCGFVCGSVTITITWNCVHRSSPNWVCSHLHLVKFWPSCAPGEGVCGGAKFFVSALLQRAHSICVSLSAFSF